MMGMGGFATIADVIRKSVGFVVRTVSPGRDRLWYNGTNLIWTTAAGADTTVATSGTLSFDDIAAGTNTAALLIGTGGSLGVTGTGTIDPVMSAAHTLAWTGRSKITSAADGYVSLTDNAGTSFIGLRLGGVTSAFPMFKRNGPDIDLRNADDTAYKSLIAYGLTASGGSLQSSLNVYTSAGGYAAGLDTNGVNIASGKGLRFSSDTTFFGTADLFLTRPGAATLQLGAADAASPVAQTLQTQSTTSNDTAGQPFVLKVSQGKGTGAGGAHTVKTGYSVGSGATANVTGDRDHKAPTWTTLTAASATAFATMTYAASTGVSAIFDVTIEANDGTDYQILKSTVRVSSVRKAAGNTVSAVDILGTDLLATSAGGGTLTSTFTVTEGAGAVTLKANAASSLVETVLRVNFQARGNGPVAIAAA